MTAYKLKIKAYLDLTRAHFAPVWPLLFCSGALLAIEKYSTFSWTMLILTAMLGLFGFETGMVWNDILDHKIDTRDVEFDQLTRYWRPFGKRPIPAGLITFRQALSVWLIFLAITAVLISQLPRPHALYVFALMPITYGLESYYNIKKRRERGPWAQLFGRIDFALFPVAGYLSVGHPDLTALLFFLFFYPLAQVHLGMNDLVDIRNDEARGVNTITTLYGIPGTLRWIVCFSILHIIAALFFLATRHSAARWGFSLGFILLLSANLIILRKKTPRAALAALPMIHATMLIYIVAIIIDATRQ